MLLEAEQLPVVVREGSPEDAPFILSTWLRGHKHDSAFAARIRSDTYFRHHHDIVTKILERPTTRVHVAALDDDPTVILAYLVTEPMTIHWAHTKGEFRRFGLFTRLIHAACLPSDLEGVTLSHDSRLWRQHLEARFSGARFNPYLAFPG